MKAKSRSHTRPQRQAVAQQGAASRELLEAVPDLVFRVDSEGRFLEFKPAKDFATYVPPKEFLGRLMSDVLPAQVAKDGLTCVKQALELGVMQTLTYKLPMKSGLREYEARVVALGVDDVLIIVRDITTSGRAQSDSDSNGNEEYGLTPRQLAVLQLITVGMTDKEIARNLNISPETARTHVAGIRRKMGATSRTDAGVKAVKEGLIP